MGRFCTASKYYNLAQRELQKLPPSEFAVLWANGDGLCTSFAIHVSEQINNNFLFHDLRSHHRASLHPDGIIVDSMARNLLSGAEGEIMSGYKGQWKFFKSPNLLLSFKANNSTSFNDFTPLKNREEAMVKCLLQLIYAKDIICMFRTVSSSKLCFNGRIRFDISARRICWSCRVSGGWDKASATFNGNGTPESNLNCRTSLLRFGLSDGREEQFERVAEILGRLWDGLIETFGFPELT
ncbi:hypothetical protein MauCBS54593_006295 [Microsporum audouinii]